MRLDQALRADTTAAMRSGAVRTFLLLELLAGAVLVWRRGSDTISTVALVWLGMLILAFFAWWAGRHRLAHPAPDAMPEAGPRLVFALVGVAGMLLWNFDLSLEAGLVLTLGGIFGWLWVAWRNSGFADLRQRLTRDVRPFVPLLLLVGLPRLIVGGPLYLVALVPALASGIGQQLLYLVGLYGPLEAVGRRQDLAAVVSALLFGLIHVPLLLPSNGDDLMAAFANGVIFQASVGLIACLAYIRHRAVVPIGAAHALAIA